MAIKQHKYTNVNLDPFSEDFSDFLVVARFKNFSRAAEFKGVSQSGLSKAVRRIEDALHSPVFIRKNHGLEFTHEGQKLFRNLVETKSVWEKFSDEDSNQSSIRLTLGGNRAVTAAFWPTYIKKILKHFPRTEIDFVFGTSLEVTRMVASQKIDFGIVINHVKTADVISRQVNEDSMALWKAVDCQNNKIGYNSEMLNVGKILRKLPMKNSISVPDYNVLLSMTLLGVCQGILPSTLTKNTNLEKQGGNLMSVKASLILHNSLRKQSGYGKIASLLLSE